MHPWSLLLGLLAVLLWLLLETGRVLEPGLLLPAVLEEGVLLQPRELLPHLLSQEALQVPGPARLLELLVVELVVLTAGAATAGELEHVALSAVTGVRRRGLGVTWRW